MIGFMPDFYPDELVYSLLARYYQRSGYLAYRYAAEELFMDPSARQDIYFLPRLTLEARGVLTTIDPVDDLIESHTMFPGFCRFAPLERRLTAFQAMREMRGNYDSLVTVPTRKKGEDRCLRYCPACARADREQYGETYWHRIAQIHGMDICYKHGCWLTNSDVVISGRMPPMLTPAEEVIPEESEILICSSNIQMRLAKYMEDVFSAPLSLENPTPAGDFLHSRMAWTKYRSVRGEQRNISLLADDFRQYYSGLPGNDCGEAWQLQKVLNNYRHNFRHICMLAMFLNVDPMELTDMSLPVKTQEQLFDERVRHMRDAKLKYSVIAEQLGAPYDLVKAIGEGRYGTYHKDGQNRKKCGQKELDWNAIDRDNLPRVQEYIAQHREDSTGKPDRITINGVEKALSLPPKRLQKMPLCRELILQWGETIEEYWARKLVWAINQIPKGQTISWRRLREYVNIKRDRLRACIPYLRKYADEETAQIITDILTKQ